MNQVNRSTTVVGDYHALWQQFRESAEPVMQQFYACHKVSAECQADTLSQLLAQASETPVGRHYGFASIKSYTDYTERVPISNWSGVKKWVNQACTNNPTALTAQAPLFFEPTSGSSAQHKLIPYTPTQLSEIQSAIIVWLASLFDACPAVANGRGYWAMSPPVSVPETTENGIPISGGDDIAYLQNSIVMPLLQSALSPSLSDMVNQDWRVAQLIAMIDAEDLSMMSAWSPTFLLTLLRPLLTHCLDTSNSSTLVNVLNGIAPDRRALVEQAVAEQNMNLLWPNLVLISCWADGPSALYAQQLSAVFPQSTCVPKGLWATEGVVSVSYGINSRCPLALNSHFYEFVASDESVHLAHQLCVGECYRPLLTTGGGLYRYDLGDLVEVVHPITADEHDTSSTGMHPPLICVRYVGRVDARCDLVGEKLDESLVAEALGAVLDKGCGVALVPDQASSTPGYVLLLDKLNESNAAQVGTSVEAALMKIHHYAQARALGQLCLLRVQTVSNVSAALQSGWESLDKRAGDFKPSLLVSNLPLAQILLNAPANQ